MSFESRLQRLEELAAQTDAAGKGEIDRAMWAVTGLSTAFKLHDHIIGGFDPPKRSEAMARVLEIAERGDFDGANRAAHEVSNELYNQMRRHAAEVSGDPHISVAGFLRITPKDLAIRSREHDD